MTTISILPTIVDLELQRGDAAPFTLTAFDTTGGPMPLSGCAIAFTMKEKHGKAWDASTAAVALTWTESASSGITVADLASGVIAIKIPKATMATLVPGVRYRYDVEITDAAGDPVTTHEGDVQIFADVSR